MGRDSWKIKIFNCIYVQNSAWRENALDMYITCNISVKYSSRRNMRTEEIHHVKNTPLIVPR